MVEYDRNQQREISGKEPLRICVAGVGGAGSNVLDRITMDRTVEATLVSFQTDVRVLHHSTTPRKVQLGTDLMRGVGAGGDPDLGREAALFSKEEIRNAIEGHDMVFVSVGLGGRHRFRRSSRDCRDCQEHWRPGAGVCRSPLRL